MKLRVAVDKLVLRLGVPAKRLRIAARGLRLSLSVSAMRLRVALGEFVAFLYPTDTATTSETTTFVVTKASADVAVAGPQRVEIEFRKNPSNRAGLDDGDPYFAEDYVVGAPVFQTYTLGPQVFKDVGKVLSDAPTAASLAQLLLTRGYADAFAASEARAQLFGKVLGHGVGATDDLNGAMPLDDQTISFFKSLDHIASTADSPTKLFSRGLFDGSAAAEDAVLLVAKPYFETAAAAEAYALTNTKILGHTAGASDADVLLSGKTLGDSAGAGESGSLRSQGYTVDLTYFAEDYVGASRTF